MIDNQINRFFLGSNTKQGFIPLFQQLRDPAYGNCCYILKGGPGSGKSTLMKRLAMALEEKGHVIEYIYCASDSHSLDAFIDYNANISVVDGTAPHIMDPEYPGAYDKIINLGDVWDQEILKNNKDNIIYLSNIINKCHGMATACIASAAALLDCNKSLAKPYVNKAAISTITKHLLEEMNKANRGKEKKRLISAVSVGKLVYFKDTLYNLCRELYGIVDKWGAASDILLSELHNYALINGYEIISCYCSIQALTRIDHLILPSTGLGITTINDFHTLQGKNLIVIDGLMGPIDDLLLKGMEQNLASAKSLIDMACNHISKAKELHDVLETYYIKAMNFTKLDGIYDKIIKELI